MTTTSPAPSALSTSPAPSAPPQAPAQTGFHNIVVDVAAWAWPRRKLIWSELRGVVTRSLRTDPDPRHAASPVAGKARPLRWKPGVIPGQSTPLSARN